VWRGLSAAWFVATEAGAPLAPSLRDFAISLRALANAEREIDVALAAPIATARMVMVLPVVAVLFGLVLGFNTIETLATTPVGWGCLAVAAALMLIARAWNRRLLRSAQPKQLTPGLRFELMAIGVAGGGSLDRARATVAAALDLSLLDAGEEDGVEAVLDLSRRAGVPAAELLRSEAEESRRTARADAEKRAAVLAVRLMLPLGLCILPAFMALGVVPLVVSVIASTVSTF
jgi:tight adherence protein B